MKAVQQESGIVVAVASVRRAGAVPTRGRETFGEYGDYSTERGKEVKGGQVSGFLGHQLVGMSLPLRRFLKEIRGGAPESFRTRHKPHAVPRLLRAEKDGLHFVLALLVAGVYVFVYSFAVNCFIGYE